MQVSGVFRSSGGTIAADGSWILHIPGNLHLRFYGDSPTGLSFAPYYYGFFDFTPLDFDAFSGEIGIPFTSLRAFYPQRASSAMHSFAYFALDGPMGTERLRGERIGLRLRAAPTAGPRMVLVSAGATEPG